LASTRRELIVASHFDYESQAILFVPPDLPIPALRVRRQSRHGHPPTPRDYRGRAFVLFTSYKQMNEVYERLLGLLDYPCSSRAMPQSPRC